MYHELPFFIGYCGKERGKLGKLKVVMPGKAPFVLRQTSEGGRQVRQDSRTSCRATLLRSPSRPLNNNTASQYSNPQNLSPQSLVILSETISVVLVQPPKSRSNGSTLCPGRRYVYANANINSGVCSHSYNHSNHVRHPFIRDLQFY